MSVNCTHTQNTSLSDRRPGWHDSNTQGQGSGITISQVPTAKPSSQRKPRVPSSLSQAQSRGHRPMGHKPILTQTSLKLHGKLKPQFEFCKQQQGQSQIKGYPTSWSSQTVCMLCNFLKATQTTATKLYITRRPRVLAGSSHPRWGVRKAAGGCPGCCSRFRSARLDPDNTWMSCQLKKQKWSLPRLLELQKITTYLHSYTWLWLWRFVYVMDLKTKHPPNSAEAVSEP